MNPYRLYNDINTGLAWEKVYNRLREDGLVKEGTGNNSRRRAALPVAVAVVVACLCITTLFILQSKSGAPAGLAGLSLYNEKGAATLVATLEDGSIVYLGEGARLDYPEHFPAGHRTVYLKGRALFDVSRNAGRPFFIETDRMIIEVTGTAFDVESNNNTLSVRHGEVKATVKKSGQSLHVRKGETAAIAGGRLTVGQTTDANRFARYMEQLRFKGEKLGNILRVINNRENGIELRATPGLDDRQITVAFAGNEPAENIAGIICSAFDLELYKDESKQVLIISAKP